MPDEEELRQARKCHPSKEDYTLEELMIEVLLEENHLKRYEDIRIADIALLPTETDVWDGEE